MDGNLRFYERVSDIEGKMALTP